MHSAFRVILFCLICFGPSRLGWGLTLENPLWQGKAYEAILPNAIDVSAVSHHVSVHADGITLLSEWVIADLAGAKSQLLFGFDEEPKGRVIRAVTLAGAALKHEPVPDSDRYFLIELPKKPSTAMPMTLTIETAIEDKEAVEAMRLLSVNDLPKIARLRPYEGKYAWDLRAMSAHSYGDVLLTSFSVERPREWLVVGSSPVAEEVKAKAGLKTRFEAMKSGRYSVLLLNGQHWQVENFKNSDTDFSLVSRRKGAVLNKAFMMGLVEQVWPRYLARFGAPSRHVVLVDSDWAAVTGGLLGSNMPAFFAKAKLSPGDKEDFKAIFGQDLGKDSTKANIEVAYAGAKDPWRDYMTAMLAHELAHLYFGFGRTTERVAALHDLWFSLGLGLVYDEILTKELTGKQDKFFAAVEKRWQTAFANNPKLDQRLIHPDTGNDKAFGLSRAHIYGHGKALSVLRELRERVKPERFDALVLEYLNAACKPTELCVKPGELGGYAVFRDKLLSVYPQLPKFEAELNL